MTANNAGSSRACRVGLVDDQKVVEAGVRSLLASQPDLRLVAAAVTVRELLGLASDLAVVILDLRLADGSVPADNVRQIRQAGAHALVFTVGDQAALARSATRAGAWGVVRKSEPLEVLVTAVRMAAAGRPIVATEWAAAPDGDPELCEVGLSSREREVLAMYASGEKSQRVAHQTGLALPTVKEYVDRIRVKYARAGRPAPTKVDLYRRAVEDGLLPAPAVR